MTSDAADRRSVLSLCDWLPPDFGAVGQYALAEARERAAAGERVTLVGLSSTASAVEEGPEGDGQLRVVRIRRPLYDRAEFARRALWTLATNTRLVWAARRELRRAHEVIFTGSPPFLLHWIVPLNVFFRRRLRYRISDFHPEVLLAELGRAAWPLRLLLAWTRFLRRRVDRLEALGEDQRLRLLESGVPADRIEVRPSGTPVDVDPGAEPLARPEALAGRVALLYSGNLGVAHDDATMVEGLRLHHAEGSGRVALWLNATGAKADLVEKGLRDLGVPHARSTPVPLELLARLLVTPDAHLITLRDAFSGYVLPSKVHGCLASGRPLVYVGPESSDVHRLARGALPEGDYRRIGIGDARGFAQALEDLADRTAERVG